jgi:hypothetical protein
MKLKSYCYTTLLSLIVCTPLMVHAELILDKSVTSKQLYKKIYPTIDKAVGPYAKAHTPVWPDGFSGYKAPYDIDNSEDGAPPDFFAWLHLRRCID